MFYNSDEEREYEQQALEECQRQIEQRRLKSEQWEIEFAAKCAREDARIAACDPDPLTIDLPMDHPVQAMKDNDIQRLERILTANPEWINQVDNTKRHHTLMHYAAILGRHNMIDTLVQMGCRHVDTPAHDGETPMQYAVVKRHPFVIRALMQHGCRIIDSEVGTFTFLILAAGMNDIPIIDALVYNGSQAANIMPEDSLGSPLHTAASNGNLRAVERLIYHGSEINAIDPLFKMTPLGHGLEGTHIECARVLLAMGADPTLGYKYRTSDERLQLVSEPLEEEFILAVRERIYFFPLFQRLIYSI